MESWPTYLQSLNVFGFLDLKSIKLEKQLINNSNSVYKYLEL